MMAITIKIVGQVNQSFLTITPIIPILLILPLPIIIITTTMIFIDLTFTITTGFATLQTQPGKQTFVQMNPNESHLVELSVWK